MQFRYGGHIHEDGEVSLSINSGAALTSGGVPYLNSTRWTLTGMLVGVGDTAEALIADLATKINALVQGYKQTGVDAELIGSAHYIRHSDTLSGIRVIQPPYFPIGINAEHVTYRTYQIGLEADLVINPGQPLYLAYDERIAFWGGGPERVRTRPILGYPQWQDARQNTDFMASQSGSAVGFNFQPFPPPAYWPNDMVEVNGRQQYMRGGRPKEKAVTWEYLFASSSGFGGGAAIAEIPVLPGLNTQSGY